MISDDQYLDLQRQVNAINRQLDDWRGQPQPFAFANLMAAEISSNSGAAARWLRLASLPKSESDTSGLVFVECIGGRYSSTEKFRIIAKFGNRSVFTGILEQVSGDTTQLTHARLVAYTDSGVTTIYLYLPGTTWAHIAAHCWKSAWGTGATLYPGEAYSTSTPAGSLVFDSYTAAATLILTDGGDIYTVPWTDYSAASTITGWASFTVKAIQYKKIGKIVYWAAYLSGTSNATTASFSLPYTAANTTVNFVSPATVVDNGTSQATPGRAQIPANTNLVTVGLTWATSAGWTNSGTKTVVASGWYEAA
jgi:hypothetical protein